MFEQNLVPLTHFYTGMSAQTVTFSWNKTKTKTKTMLSSAEAQQWESFCNTAMHNINHDLYPVLLNFFVLFSQEEEEEEEGRQEEA